VSPEQIASGEVIVLLLQEMNEVQVKSIMKGENAEINTKHSE
jgi:hypothetical protein